MRIFYQICIQFEDELARHLIFGDFAATCIENFKITLDLYFMISE
jgi:hypothetical protein